MLSNLYATVLHNCAQIPCFFNGEAAHKSKPAFTMEEEPIFTLELADLETLDQNQ